MEKVKVVVVGAGFGGVAAARALAKSKKCIVHLIDRRNFHLFQPLLYQVAMAGLNPSDIATPLRRLFAGQKNIFITLAEVDHIDLISKKVFFDSRELHFDYLILSCGAKHFYFGNDQWEDFAPGLKTLEQATEIRRRILTAFELAEKETDVKKQEEYLTFVIIGGGPTGVEMAGAIAEMASRTLYKDYRVADLSKTKVILCEAGPRVLAAFPPELSEVAHKNLSHLGVDVRLNARADKLSENGLNILGQFISAHTIIWAAGVKPASLSQELPTPKDTQGRILVSPDMSLPDFPNVFSIGDQSALKDGTGKWLPGIAPVAIQQGQFVGKLIFDELNGKPRGVFKYFDKGMMATIGRTRAVVSMGRFQFHGFLAWLTWVFIHILYLMRFRNRVFVLMQWIWSYFRFGHGARLILHKTWRFYSGEKIKIQ